MNDVIHLDRVPPAEQFDGWREAVSNTFVPLEAAALSERAFGGAVGAQAIGQVQLCQVSGGPVQVARTARTIRRSDPEFYKLSMQVRGYCLVEQDGREATLAPGEFAIYDTTRPYTVVSEQDFRILVVMFPRSLLGLKPSAMTAVTARRVSGQQGMGALVSPFLDGLAHQMDADDMTPSVHLADAVVDLLAATFAERLGYESAVPAETHRHALMLRIKAFIDARLDDPDLSSATIAGAHYISVRYLQKLFESEGCTVAGWIRARRLERCRIALADPKLGALPVSAIAARWGLVDASHFARLFKAAYGHSPREYRLSLR